MNIASLDPFSGNVRKRALKALVNMSQSPAKGSTEQLNYDDPILSEDPKHHIIAGAAVGGLFGLGLLGLGIFAQLDSAVTAPGQVVVAGNRQSVQHRDGGTVAELDVHEGDRVITGQVLARLNADEIRANVQSASTQVIELEALEARLKAELAGMAMIVFPADFDNYVGPEKAAAVAAAALQRTEFTTRRAAIETEKSVLTQRQREASQEITGYQRQASANLEQQQLIQQEMGSLRGLLDKGLVPATRMRALQRNAAELSGGEGQYSATIAKTQEEIGENRIRISDLERERAADDSKAYRETEFQLADLQPKLVALKQSLERSIIRSPATGRVVGLNTFTVGGVITPGQTLMTIVPEGRPLVIDAKVKPTDVSDLKVGQRTEIRFGAFRNRGLPTLHGIVDKISADSFADEKTGAPFFEVEVSVPAEELQLMQKTLGGDGKIQPGLPAELVIPLRKRSGLQYLLEPLHSAIWRSFREH